MIDPSLYTKSLMRPYPSDSASRRYGIVLMVNTFLFSFFRASNPSIPKVYKVPPPTSAPPLPVSAQRNPPVYPMYATAYTLILPM